MAVMAGRAALRRAGEPGAMKLKDTTNIPLGGPQLSSEEQCNDSEPETREISGPVFKSYLRLCGPLRADEHVASTAWATGAKLKEFLIIPSIHCGRNPNSVVLCGFCLFGVI